MPHLTPRYRPAVLTVMLASLIAHSAAAAEPPFSLGSKERVEEIRRTFAIDWLPDPLMSHRQFDPDYDPETDTSADFKFYREKGPQGVVVLHNVLLYRLEIVSEDIFFKAPAQEPLTTSETVRTTVPWAAKWVESTLKRASLSEADHEYVLTEIPLYTATREGWVAKLYRVKNTGRLIVEKLGIPGLNIDDSVTNFLQKGLVEDLEARKAGKLPAWQQPFSLGSQERVAKIRKTFVEDEPPSLDVASAISGSRFYKEKAPQGMVLRRSVIINDDEPEIISEDILFQAPSQGPLTDCDIVRSTVPWTSIRTMRWSKGSLEAEARSSLYYDYVLTGVTLYIANRPDWTARLYQIGGIARLIVQKRGELGLNINDFVPGTMRQRFQEAEEAAKAKAAIEKAAKAKP